MSSDSVSLLGGGTLVVVMMEVLPAAKTEIEMTLLHGDYRLGKGGRWDLLWRQVAISELG